MDVDIDGVATHVGTLLQCSCRILQLSLGGVRMLFAEEAVPSVGQIYELEFCLPGQSEDLKIQAVIRWVDYLSTGLAGLSFLRGLTAKEALAVVA